MTRTTSWDELDYADSVLITYRCIRNPGADPDPDVWAEMHISEVDWTAGWIDGQVAESTYRPGVDSPTFVMERRKTTFSWGADAAHLEILVLVGDALFGYALGKGLDKLGGAINERLRGAPVPRSTVEEVEGQARQRIAVRYDTNGARLVLLESRASDDDVTVVLCEPDRRTKYEVTVKAYGGSAQVIICSRVHDEPVKGAAVP